MAGKTIQTEVDSHVSLINEDGRISDKNVARKLGIAISTVIECATFLEEEGVINIEYKFTTFFLVKKGLSQDQMKLVKKEVVEEKDIFIRKSQNTMAYLTKLEEEIDSLKDIFQDLGTHFKKKISEAKSEFNELKKAEAEKEDLNKAIIESKQKFVKQVAYLNKELLQKQSDSKMNYKLL